MIQVLIATMAFSLGLVAFCAGAWLTIWATSSNQCTEVAAAKLTGYFVSILAIISLVCTSYYVAKAIFGQPKAHPSYMTKAHKGMKGKNSSHYRNTNQTNSKNQ